MLKPYRVLDLTDHRGAMCTSILGALGAEIILVEGPDGRGRRHRQCGPDGTSLGWWSLRRGAQSCVIADRPELLELAAGADALIESPDPGLGLDRAELRSVNPGLVHTTVTAFGSTGPKSGWAASDLTIAAAAGSAAITGDADRAPLRITAPQSWLHAGSHAAVGTALALRQRDRSGYGQHVDVSAQQAMMQTAFPGIVAAPNAYPSARRTSGGILLLNFHLQFVYPAADGYVSVTLLFGDTMGRFTARLMDWVREEGCCDDELAALDWVDFGMRLFTDPDLAPSQLETTKAAIARLTRSRTRAELFAQAQRRELLLAPVYSPAELTGVEHFSERGYWDTVEDPAWGSVVAPGAWCKPSGAPLRSLGGPPALGAHTAAVKAKPPSALLEAAARVRAGSSGGEGRGDRSNPRPLAGINVLDTTWVYAGPFTTRVLADFGATVIKVEGPARFDASRGGGGGLKGDMSPDASIQYGTLNAGKLGVTIDLNVAEGREAFCDLAAWADIFVESYTPGTLDAWGIGWQTLSARNPSLVMLSTSLMGQTGPLATFAGFGNLAGAITGYYEMTGWPDRPPAGPFLAYTDYVTPQYMVPLLLAALDARDADPRGRGQHLDFAQAEAAVHFLAAEVLEHTVNGTAAGRMGNADAFMCPHAMYACASSGDGSGNPLEAPDPWVAVVCETEQHWASLCGVLEGDGQPVQADLVALDAAGRLARSGDVDDAVAAWAAARTPEEAQAALQAVGVPAHACQNSHGCLGDPQLVHRGHWMEVEHPLHERMIVEAPRLQLSATPHHLTRSGPSLGEHNNLVLRDILGYDDDQVVKLAAAGALG
ncbi:CoA transferase [Candidatus Poriferisodalis sp.]|uniref:CaiB/BaiF CoA-transferase family protein n=1 Tax=Candidatus Poriferisodalis sp. TaxID=3101277 RepID=UPI003B02CC4B